MNPGRCRQKVNIQQELTTQNTYGEPTQEWVNFLSNVFCAIEPIRGREFLSSNAMQGEITHRIWMRFRQGIKPKMRISYCGRLFYIESAINVMERGQWLEILAKEGDLDE